MVSGRESNGKIQSFFNDGLSVTGAVRMMTHKMWPMTAGWGQSNKDLR